MTPKDLFSLHDRTYCIDTSVWIAFWRNYPVDIFPSLWNTLEKLIAENRIVIPKEVDKEIRQGLDELPGWIHSHKNLIV